MQTSQPFTAAQCVSLNAYQRLREALLQQSALFESVMTETQFEAQFSGVISTAEDDSEGTGEVKTEAKAELTDRQQAIRFVVMRSPTLSVLFTATPLTSSAHDDTPEMPPVSADISAHKNSTLYALSSALGQRDFLLHLQVDDIDSIDSHSASPKPDLSNALNSIRDSVAPSSQPYDYEVQLSFDESAIAAFIAQLTPKNDMPLAQPLESDVSSATAAINSQRRRLADDKAPNRESPNRESFVLSWTKQLATSPDGAAQATLDNQLQQSLLLNQVITRIRHSLDLPAILETTVAQVREFLSADRLVLYQFDQLESVDLSSPSSTKPFSAKATDLHTGSDAIIGRCTHEGHITYESRVSDSISSVLNFSESACFMPSLSIRSRYIMGQPVAVNDVDQHYAHAGCLLDFLHQAQVKSKIIAPIIVQDQLWGLLIAHQCEAYRHWQETEVMFLQHIAEHLAVAIGQAGLYQQLQKQTVNLESCVLERTQNLHDALLAAESADLTKGEFLSTMSHELRTPLTYIIGMSATLLRWSFGELSDRQRSYLNTINHSGEQLLEIINDILEFAKISSGRTFLDVSEFSLKALVQEVVAHFQSIADKQEVALTLRFDITADEDTFQADTKRLKQILSNLVHNAIKFTPASGQVVLRIMRDGDMGVFQVEDTGIGIPESQRGLLFEKFKQLESPFQRQYSGTGLGLAMTKRLVELHGGTIQVKSTVGKGSVFSVRLPQQTTASERDRYQVPLTISNRSKRILLLEVEKNSAAIICDLLTADGYEVIWQEDAEKMLPQLTSLRPAMLIADLSLLSHDLNEIKKVQLSITDIGTKVLALIDQPMSHSSHIAHHDTLQKPIDPKKLLEKVRQL